MDIACATFPQLVSVDHESVSFSVRPRWHGAQAPGVHISPGAWSAVMRSFAQYEIVEVHVEENWVKRVKIHTREEDASAPLADITDAIDVDNQGCSTSQQATAHRPTRACGDEEHESSSLVQETRVSDLPCSASRAQPRPLFFRVFTRMRAWRV